MNTSPRAGKRIILPIQPMANTRHRCRCIPGYKVGRPYLASDYREWRKEAVKLLKDQPLGDPFEGPVQVWMRFAFPRPKSTKLRYPKPDIDNLQKSILDAMTDDGRVWKDDFQVVRIIEASKVWTDAPTGGIVVDVIQLEDSFYT